MGGSSTSSESTSFSQREPWGPAQPYVKEAMKEGQDLFHWYRPTTYENLVPNFSPMQELAMKGTAQRAVQGSPLEQGAQGVAWDQMYGSRSPFLGQMMQNASDPSFGAGRALPHAYHDWRTAQGPNPAFPYMQNTASGGWLGSNPYLDNMFGAQSDAITRQYREATNPSTEANFSAAGRLRGGDAAGGSFNSAVARNEAELMRGLENTAANVYGNAYNMERGLMEQQTANYANQYNNWLANQRAATTNLANIGSNAAQAQMGAAQIGGSQFFQGLNNQMNAANNAANLAQIDYRNLANLFDVGQQQYNQLAKKNHDAARVHEFYNTGQGSPYAILSNYYNQALPMSQLGGTSFQHSMSETEQDPGFLGYLSLGTKLLGGLPGF